MATSLILASNSFLTGASVAQTIQHVEAAPGVQIRVLEAGRKSSPLTIVLVPGWRFTADIWKSQVEAFSEHYRVVTLDPRSQGDSTKTLSGNTPEDRAVDLHSILAQIDACNVVLVGWSQGAQDVAAYVGKYGASSVRGLIFVDAAPAQGWDRVAALPSIAQQLRQVSLYERYPQEATEGMMSAVFKTPQSHAETEKRIADALKTPPTIGAAMLEDDLFGPDRMSAMAKVDLQVLLIAADASPNQADLDVFSNVLVRKPVVHVVAGAGHATFVDRPEAFDALVLTFLESLQRP